MTTAEQQASAALDWARDQRQSEESVAVVIVTIDDCTIAIEDAKPDFPE